MSVRLLDSLGTTAPLADLFSDHSILCAMLMFEAALARAEARYKIVPQNAADAIAKAAQSEGFDVATIIQETRLSATPGVPLVKALTERVRVQNSAAVEFVHWGATSQDVCDTALVLLLKQAQPILESDLLRLEKVLHRLGAQHARTVMPGRTLLQAAGPVTFGLKAAGWLAAIHRSHKRLNAAFKESLQLQFGGATGTLAALGNDGITVGESMAQDLGLSYPEAPWHTQRDRLANLLCCCGVLAGSVAKMARDISLLTQTEVGEVTERTGEGRGSSSSMPHKANPVGCTQTLAATSGIPGLVSTFLSAMVQEQERAVGGWQAEWPIVAGIIQRTGLGVSAMAETIEGLTVDQARMRANLEATRGTVFAEKATMLLAGKIGHDAARKLVEEAVRKSADQKRQLSEVLGEMPEVKHHLDPATLRDLESPEQYLGVGDEFRKRLLDSVKEHGSS
ncbi:MAG TPA: 3-carboxy-cis,cis-muconate cycloisomerase [Candidatus Angelobacter sp.]